MQPALTVVVVIGEERRRAQAVVDAIADQTAARELELLLVDLNPAAMPVRLRATVRARALQAPPGTPWGAVKAMAVREAASPHVAFLEDHSIPDRAWAAAVRTAASRQPWAAAGYVFRNANPKTYLSRAGFVTDYLEWADPVPDIPMRRLPCNNIAYRRDVLLAYGSQLDTLLASDSLLHERLLRDGHPVTQLRDAVVWHQNHERWAPLLAGNFWHCRIVGAGRVAAGSWGWGRRLVYAIAVPVCVPWMRLYRLLRVQAWRSTLWAETLCGLPVALLVFLFASLGESLGYVFGFGAALRRFQVIETSLHRSADFERGIS